MITRTQENRRNRRAQTGTNGPTGSQATITASVVANKFRVTSNLPVVIRGIPLSFKVTGASPTAVTQISATVFDLTYAVNVAATQAWVIGSNDPAIRTFTGGFVAAAAGTF